MQAKPCHFISPMVFKIPENFPSKRKFHFQPNVTLTQFVSTLTSRQAAPEVEMDDRTMAFWDYQSLFTSQRLEVMNPIKLRLINGAIPKDFPCGTYYLTGPGMFFDDYGSTVHPLDGHGYLRAFQIDGPKEEVKFSAKYVKTEAQMEECDPISGSWRFTHRGPFSVLKGGKKFANTKVMKNVANTSILKWNGRLFCLWEGGTPYEIDPGTLDTIGSFDLINGDDECCSHHGKSIHVWDIIAHLLKPILYGIFKMPPKRLLSHYKVDARRGRLIIMACNAEDMLLPQSHFTFYEYNMNFKLLQKREFNVSDHLMIHDWAFTNTHYILFGNRLKLDLLGSMGAICGVEPMISAVSVNDSKATSPVYLLPRISGTKSSNSWKKPIEAPQLWLLHVANAFEEQLDDHGSFRIHIHATACAYQWFNFQTMFGYNWQSHILDPSVMNGAGKEQMLPHLVEVCIELNENGNHRYGTVTSSKKQSRSRCSDFPIINPRYSGYKHRFVYLAASSGSYKTLPNFPFDSIVKCDTLTEKVNVWSPGNRTFVGEPMFVCRGPSEVAEDDGYLLVVEYEVSNQRCNLVILDAKRIGEKSALVARFEVPKYLTFPLGFHGTWTPKE